MTENTAFQKYHWLVQNSSILVHATIKKVIFSGFRQKCNGILQIPFSFLPKIKFVRLIIKQKLIAN